MALLGNKKMFAFYWSKMQNFNYFSVKNLIFGSVNLII